VIADPRTADSAAPRHHALLDIARLVTMEPWTLSRPKLKQWHDAGLTDEDVLHAIALASYFGHLNRIADATAVPLDYDVRNVPAHADPSIPPWPEAPKLVTGRAALDMAILRPATAAALTEWKTYMFHRDAPLTRRQRTLVVRHVAAWLGDGGISSPADLTANTLDDALRALAQTVTLAPWQLSDASYAPLREVGFDDAALFDVVATATSAGVFSRIAVALAALAA
jgi:alkylhydroperoxidase family enzyme